MADAVSTLGWEDGIHDAGDDAYYYYPGAASSGYGGYGAYGMRSRAYGVGVGPGDDATTVCTVTCVVYAFMAFAASVVICGFGEFDKLSTLRVLHLIAAAVGYLAASGHEVTEQSGRMYGLGTVLLSGIFFVGFYIISDREGMLGTDGDHGTLLVTALHYLLVHAVAGVIGVCFALKSETGKWMGNNAWSMGLGVDMPAGSTGARSTRAVSFRT